jgi:ABC-type uncharacterized transport system YnjBCD permease subunit
MRKIFFSLLFLLICSNTIGQDTTNAMLSKEGYLKKSKGQKVTAWILLGVGSGLIAGSVATHKQTTSFTFFPAPYTKRDNLLSTLLSVPGYAAIIGSIVYFESSRANKKKAATRSFNNQQILFPVNRAMVMKTQHSLTLRIKF